MRRVPPVRAELAASGVVRIVLQKQIRELRSRPCFTVPVEDDPLVIYADIDVPDGPHVSGGHAR